jgi:MinD-like ATPase involved in chromosome partitioning or flagellar assembly
MDLDLAAPGLHMIFPKAEEAHAHSNQIHDYLKSDQTSIHIEDYIIDISDRIEETRHEPPDGELVLLSGKVDSPGQGVPKELMQKTLELKEDFISNRNLDYLLIDSRSGLSNHMIPIFTEANIFIAFHRWTHQHKLGTTKLAEWIDGIPYDLDMDMMSVASNVREEIGDDDIEEWVAENLYSAETAPFSDFHVINSSEILRKEERIVRLVDEEAQVVTQFQKLADKIKGV